MSQYPSLEDLPATTMTYVVNLEGNIDLESVYECFPLIPINIPTNKKKTKNKKIPHLPENKGKMYTIKYGDNTRGNIVSIPETGKYLKNSVLLKLGLHDKNVAVGISKSSFHITGVKNYSNVQETVEYLMQYLRDTQELLEYISLNPEKVTEIDNWILKNLRGENDVMNRVEQIPDTLDAKIIGFLKLSWWEFTNFDDYYSLFQWIIKCKEIITPDLKVIGDKLIMANYNYDLGFLINRDELAQRIRNETEFTVIYDNSETYYIKIELPYIRDESFDLIRKKPKIPKHTLLIYKSGKVTQSGPGFDLMKICYDKFRTEICRLRPYIERRIRV